MRRNDAEIFALRRSGVRGMKISSAEYPGRRSQSAKSSAGVGYRFAMGKPSAGRGMKGAGRGLQLQVTPRQGSDGEAGRGSQSLSFVLPLTGKPDASDTKTQIGRES